MNEKRNEKTKNSKVKNIVNVLSMYTKKMTSQGDLFQVQGFEVQRSV